MLRAEHLSFSVTEEGKKRTIIDDISGSFTLLFLAF